MAQTAHPAQLSECRQCCSFCDRMVLPAGCLAAGCKYVYVYDEERTGRRYMGCLQKVYKVEIDLELFEQAERTRHGFGGVKMTGAPLPQCRSAVDRAYHGEGDAFECVNPAFLRDDLQPAGHGGFDLRDRL